jgi:hypothetical protein
LLLSLEVGTTPLVNAAHIELGRRVEPEEVRAPDVDTAELRGPSHLGLPVLFVRVHRSPDVGLFHLEFGEFHAMMGLDVLVGVAPERLLKRAKGGHPTDPDDAADFVKRDAAQTEGDDLLLAPGCVGFRLRGVRIAAVRAASLGFICCLIHCCLI